jgi:L-asparaginase
MNRSKTIRILSTGGTFNKVYNPLTGTLDVDPTAKALDTIAKKWLTEFEIQTLIGKDSLEMDDADRQKLLDTIRQAPENTLIVIHGTDTLDRSAAVVAEASLEKRVIFTGAMMPFSVDPIEATANLASAVGYAHASNTSGVYIAMNGCIGIHTEVVKDRLLGRFVCR